MGEKSRRNKNNGGPLRKGLAAVPTAAEPNTTDIFKTVTRLMDANKIERIMKVESKYCHLDSFSNDPFKNVCVLYAFGHANHEACCFERAIHYYERAKEHEDANADDRNQTSYTFKSGIGMCLACLYSEVNDMEKAISSYRWYLANCSRDGVSSNYFIRLSHNFNRF